MKSVKRIDTLDGYRSLAIISVMFFHFYSRYNFPDSRYVPYDPLFNDIFSMGFFGVKFFFIISGFVIFYTLERSASLSIFFLRRLAKLFPPILLCSLLTFFLVDILDPSVTMPELHSFSAINFLPSLTFTSPTLWDTILHVTNIKFINGSYWSLYVEMSFYIMAGLLFFFNKRKFASNWIRLIAGFTILRIIAVAMDGMPHFHFLEAVPFAYEKFHWVYFTLGIFFYCLYFNKPISRLNYMIVLIMAGYQFYIYDGWWRLAFLITIAFFVLFVYKSGYMGFFRSKLMTRIGLISYSVYLIHEYLGIVLIHNFARYTHNLFIIRLIPIFVMFLSILAGEILYRVYEAPVHSLLKRWIDKLKKPVPVMTPRELVS